MDIILIGTGNTATILGRKLKLAGHHILQVYGRDARAASELAYELDTDSTNYWTVVRTDADVYLLAVSDGAINEVAGNLRVPGRVVAHTAGAVKQDVLKQCSEHYGVFYPLQTLRKELEDLPELSVLIEASDDRTRKVLEKLAASIASHTAMISDGDRQKLHVAAVTVNNFTNYLYALAEEYCAKEKLDFGLLHPLILETAQRTLKMPPSESQTGPAIRHDSATLKQHLAMLDKHPELKKVYAFLSEQIEHHSFHQKI